MIFTLPITVKDNAPLGYWLTPILADALSKQSQEQGIVFYGSLGLRSATPLTERVFHGKLDFLNLTCERKPDSDLKAELLSLSQEMMDTGSIEYREHECYRCPCGCLELPVLMASFAKEKTFTRLNGAYVCKVCGKDGKVTRVKGGFLHVSLDWSLDSICVYPESYRRELEELVRQLREQGIPLSRARETGLSQHGLNLDVDFVWSMIPLLLSRQYPGERIRLVVTNHVLRQAAVAFLLAQALNADFKADLIVSPCITHPGVLEKWNMNRLIELGFSGDLLRFMLIGSLGWQTKDAHLYVAPAAVEHRRFMLLRNRVREAQKSLVSWTSLETLQNLCQQNLALGLRHVFNPERFNYQTLQGVL